MTSYLRRQRSAWRPQMILGDHVDFAAKVRDNVHLALLEQWDEPGYARPATRPGGLATSAATPIPAGGATSGSTVGVEPPLPRRQPAGASSGTGAQSGEEGGRRPMIRLLIADDHAVVRVGLRRFLELDDGIEVLAEEARNGQEAVELARRTRPDVVVMDLLMPELDGIAATRVIHEELPDTAVIVLTSLMEDSPETSVAEAVRAGAVGYLLKTSDADELKLAVHAAASGQMQLTPEAARRLVSEMSTVPVHTTLTPRETEVLSLLAQGKSNKEIARDLSIGQQTVKTYVGNILSKLGLQSRTQAALHAQQFLKVRPS